MMGRQDRDQRQLFYEFSLDEMIPCDALGQDATRGRNFPQRTVRLP
jgi:hypothetical protein